MLRLIVCLLPLLFCACQSGKMRQEMERVDSLNREMVPLDTITTMDEVVGFYDKWGSAEERMTAHYLLGCVYRDRNNAPMAYRCYRDAVSFADTTDVHCNYLRLSRIYGQVAELFHQQRAPRQEIEAELQAIRYARKAEDTLSAIVFHTLLASAHHMLNNMDSVLYYSQTAQSEFERYGRKDYAAACNIFDMDVHLRQHNYQKAKQSIDKYEGLTGFFDSCGNACKGKEVFYGFKGDYYVATGKMDSAAYYFQKLQAHATADDHYEKAYQGLLSVYQRLRQPDSIAKYANLYCQANDSVSLKHAADEIIRMQTLYNYEESEQLARQKAEEVEGYKRMIVLSVVALSLLFAVVYYLFRRRERRRRDELRLANTAYHSLLTRYQQVQRDMLQSKQNIEQFVESKAGEIQELQRQLAYYKESPSIMEQWDIEQAMLDSPLVRALHQMAAKVKKPSQKQWIELRRFFEIERPDFYRIVSSKENMLTLQEVTVCILIRLQFSQGEIAALFGVSKQRVNNIKSSVNKKLFGQTGASLLDTRIMTL